MPATALIRARIDPQIKEEASTVLAAMGLTVSEACRLLLTRIARDKALPFDLLVPSTDASAALRAAGQGKLAPFDSIEDLRAHLRVSMAAKRALPVRPRDPRFR